MNKKRGRKKKMKKKKTVSLEKRADTTLVVGRTLA